LKPFENPFYFIHLFDRECLSTFFTKRPFEVRIARFNVETGYHDYRVFRFLIDVKPCNSSKSDKIVDGRGMVLELIHTNAFPVYQGRPAGLGSVLILSLPRLPS